MADDVAELARSLYRAAEVAPEQAHKVVEKGAVNIKRAWRETWERELTGHLKHLHLTVGYDISDAGGDEIIAIIGPDKDMEALQGALGGIAEYGSVNNAPIPGGAPALAAETEPFTEHLGAMGADLLDGKA